MSATCPVCGGSEFAYRHILWPALIIGWGLDDREVEYINRQQGVACVRCGSNLRSMALAQAIRNIAPRFVGSVLEVNEAGSLTPWLAKHFTRHKLVKWPDVDMRALPFDANAFDFVIHSDTLEHVEGFAQALRECHRVIRPGGALLFTVPTLVAKLTRSTQGRPPTYHGPDTEPGLRVHTEFGADVWGLVLAAGFERVEFTCIEWPAGIAITARK